MNTDSNTPNAPSDGLLEHLERALIAGRLNRRGFLRAAAAAGFFTVGLSALADEPDHREPRVHPGNVEFFERLEVRKDERIGTGPAIERQK